MAASSWNALQPYLGVLNGELPEIIEFPEKATQSFKAGTPVKLTTTAGTVEIATDGTAGFLGIAMEDASGTTNAAMPVMVCRADTPIYARVTNDGTDALPTTLTQGQYYGWYADADSVFYADANDSAVITLIYEQPVYDVNGDSTYWGKFSVVPGAPGNLDEALGIRDI